MKKLCILILVLGLAKPIPAFFDIEDVSVTPSSPSPSDVITVYSQGQVEFGLWTFDHSDFTANGSDLTVDIYFNVPDTVIWIITSWDHSKQIGTLSAGDYDLTVNTYSIESSGIQLDDTVEISFTVVPEPAALTLLMLGGMIMAGSKRTHLPPPNQAR